MKLWLIAGVGVLVVGMLLILAGENFLIGALSVMLGILWLLFVWLIVTVFARRAKRSGVP